LHLCNALVPLSCDLHHLANPTQHVVRKPGKMTIGGRAQVRHPANFLRTDKLFDHNVGPTHRHRRVAKTKSHVVFGRGETQRKCILRVAISIRL
jgi:hypothetical protein